jgi:hypothetical protein
VFEQLFSLDLPEVNVPCSLFWSRLEISNAPYRSSLHPVIRKLKVEVFGNYFLAHRQCPYREKQTAPSFMKLGAQLLW